MSFFVTSQGLGRGGNLGGLAGADLYCKALAQEVGQGAKRWRAYLSTTGEDGVNAKDRIGSGPWHNADGELIAEDIDDLLNNRNKINSSTALDEFGRRVNGIGHSINQHDILTGTTKEGIASDSRHDTTCKNWTSNGTGSAIVGHHDRRGGGRNPTSWSSAHNSRGCSQTNLSSSGGAGLYYCFVEN